ncbi:hypothetical protein CVV68_04385 [Arthrobacter livingstonensis]|uniref:Uncharacterized protein n=1 Tax=Arthrobacter livingstonensis TaxID=670078 RepID=A0A2V5M1F9_9MICC|nr:hypothetical protein CVV68_04385 [Arthrobacter livingstonensis]
MKSDTAGRGSRLLRPARLDTGRALPPARGGAVHILTAPVRASSKHRAGQRASHSRQPPDRCQPVLYKDRIRELTGAMPPLSLQASCAVATTECKDTANLTATSASAIWAGLAILAALLAVAFVAVVRTRHRKRPHQKLPTPDGPKTPNRRMNP